MYFVYIIKDDRNRLYKGMTNDINRRLSEHKRGGTKTTRVMKNLEIVYLEEVGDMKSARLREKYLKSAAGRRFLKTRINI